ncbi:hypothetical protein P3339_08805 [Microbulbifer sp. MLAF003]|uniref:hypothetical protein n=1 Tax=Microbulbifer sp. MLAF003 TaxID=3032582 RepID=UPI0024AE4BD6|nr:hypothetical protein [Microbulbifer sp. MLAF003]WHI52844.1 hypothetical protein P3339_08805 [Microbulbifer sp. MLAF003]
MARGPKKFGGPFLAGENFTAVDAFFSPVAIKINNYNLPIADISQHYVNRILELPHLRQWIKEALNEPWRVFEYEELEKKVGIIIKDLRS